MTPQELGLVVSVSVAIIGVGWKLYDITVGRQKADAAQDVKIANLEIAVSSLKVKLEKLEDQSGIVHDLQTKIGLFWRVVEDNMGDLLVKGNPISLTEIEKTAAQIYKERKRHSPTNVLKILDKAITREMPNLHPDERASFSLIHMAIKAQLLDRHEYPYST